MPHLVADAAVTSEAAPVDVDVLANDSSGLGSFDLTSFAITSAPGAGTGSITPLHTILYQPSIGFVGADTLSYAICDVFGGCASTTLTITVGNPLGSGSRALVVNAGSSASFDATTGASPPVTVSIVGAPASGTATVDLSGTVTYTPDAGFAGGDGFVYKVCDPNGCRVTSVDVTVNALPVVTADAATTPQGSAVTVDVVANDSGGLGTLDVTSVVLLVDPVHGTAGANGDGTITYVPNPGYIGSDALTYTVCDVGGGCVSGPVTITVLAVPVVTADSASVTSGASVGIDVLANDSGGSGTLDPTSVSILSGPASGTAVVQPDHTVTYTPANGFAGADFFVYSVCDIAGACAVSSATVTVNPPAVPSVVPDAATVAGPSVIVDVLANDSGGLGVLDATTLTVTTPPSAGSTVVNPDHTITYTASGVFTTDGFVYRVCDLGGGCATASVTLTAAAVPAPVLTADTATTDESTLVTIDVLANDNGGSGTLDPTTLAVTGGPGTGSATVVSGQVSYTPNAGFAGNDSFDYQVCDVGGSCGAQTVTVTVVNRAPVAAADNAITVKNTAVKIDVLGNDTDPGNDIDPRRWPWPRARPPER